jgi:hypothetical protein
MSSIAEVFPHGDPVARFIVSMSMARNDVRHALTQAGQAGGDDSPEFTYWIRVVMGHYFEAAYALERWRDVEDVRRFIAGLPEDGQAALRVSSSAVQKLGHTVLKHSRIAPFTIPTRPARIRPSAS